MPVVVEQQQFCTRQPACEEVHTAPEQVRPGGCRAAGWIEAPAGEDDVQPCPAAEPAVSQACSLPAAGSLRDTADTSPG